MHDNPFIITSVCVCHKNHYRTYVRCCQVIAMELLLSIVNQLDNEC